MPVGFFAEACWLVNMTMYIVRLAILAIAYSRKSASVQAAVHQYNQNIRDFVLLIKLIFSTN